MATALVVGAGAYGAASALQLAKAGFRVTLIDARDRIVPLRSSSGGRSRSWLPPYLPCYRGLLSRAEAAYRALERESGLTLLELRGALEIGEPGYERFEQLRGELDANGVAYEWWDEAQVRGRFPHLARPIAGALRRDDSGIIHPHRLIEAVTKLGASYGVTFKSGHTFRGANESAGRVVVDLERTGEPGIAKEPYDFVLLTVGAWTKGLLATLANRESSAFATDDTYGIFRAEKRVTPLGGFPVVTFHGVERMGFAISVESGNEVKIFPREGVRPFAPDDENPQHDTASLELCARFLADLDPAAGWRLCGSSTCTYELVFDSRPTVGPLPGFDRLWTANSSPGGGMKFAPLVAELVAHAVASGDHAPLRDFGPARFDVLPA